MSLPFVLSLLALYLLGISNMSFVKISFTGDIFIHHDGDTFSQEVAFYKAGVLVYRPESLCPSKLFRDNLITLSLSRNTLSAGDGLALNRLVLARNGCGLQVYAKICPILVGTLKNFARFRLQNRRSQEKTPLILHWKLIKVSQ